MSLEAAEKGNISEEKRKRLLDEGEKYAEKYGKFH